MPEESSWKREKPGGRIRQPQSEFQKTLGVCGSLTQSPRHEDWVWNEAYGQGRPLIGALLTKLRTEDAANLF